MAWCLRILRRSCTGLTARGTTLQRPGIWTRLAKSKSSPYSTASAALRPQAQQDGTPNPEIKEESPHVSDAVYMVLPTYFGFNHKTAIDNTFQYWPEGLSVSEGRKRALDEFYSLVAKLRSKNVDVHVEESVHEAATDAVFPNNVISFHNEDGKSRIVLYPVMAENRRLERQPAIIESWRQKLGAEIIDYTHFEQQGVFLEGTGSMVLDRLNRIAYSCRSQRTYPLALEAFCKDFDYEPVLFDSSVRSAAGEHHPIYHTNVMMSVGDGYAVVGMETVRNPEEQKLLRDSLESTGKELVPISQKQIDNFVGNMLQVRNTDGQKFLVCSTRAFESMEPDQLAVIQKHCDDILHVPLDTIETLGGGGARCMLCEVFRSR